ncbi:MAG: PEGA domain-containing protein [Treponema sp.]|nr:PEGA domain-containing protein [Treponema sp.]
MIRVIIAGNTKISLDNPGGDTLPMSYSDAALILLDEEIRFFKGIELEFIVPQTYLPYRGSLGIALYADLDRIPEPGIADLEARQISFEPVPNKIQTVYQIPLRAGHGLRTSPYASVPTGIVLPAAFPLLFRIMPIIKGIGEEIETMRFSLSVKPILGDEGAVKISTRYPENLHDRPLTILIDDEVIENPREERLIREGEHHLVVISNDYRNESRRFRVERGKVLDLTINLQDPTPLVIFEAPENAEIYLDNQSLGNNPPPMPVEPGVHEVKFQVGDYVVLKSLVVQKGKTYRVALSVDVRISEND